MTFVDVALIVGAFVLILFGAEVFTNGIEWLGIKLRISEGATGSILAALGTATPETLIPVVAILFTNTTDADEIGVGAILGAPFMLGTLVMLLIGITALAFRGRRGRRGRAVLRRLRRGLLARNGFQHAPRRARPRAARDRAPGGGEQPHLDE